MCDIYHISSLKKDGCHIFRIFKEKYDTSAVLYLESKFASYTPFRKINVPYSIRKIMAKNPFKREICHIYHVFQRNVLQFPHFIEANVPHLAHFNRQMCHICHILNKNVQPMINFKRKYATFKKRNFPHLPA